MKRPAAKPHGTGFQPATSSNMDRMPMRLRLLSAENDGPNEGDWGRVRVRVR
jgi:hypothetical protein